MIPSYLNQGVHPSINSNHRLKTDIRRRSSMPGILDLNILGKDRAIMPTIALFPVSY